jgi:hypothetical protein
MPVFVPVPRHDGIETIGHDPRDRPTFGIGVRRGPATGSRRDRCLLGDVATIARLAAYRLNAAVNARAVCAVASRLAFVSARALSIMKSWKTPS